jgi:hypothetical protein
MWCAYAFAAIAFIGYPVALKPGGEGIIAWIAPNVPPGRLAVDHHHWPEHRGDFI